MEQSTESLFYLLLLPENKIHLEANGQNCFYDEQAQRIRTELLKDKNIGRVLIIPLI